jgi:hypothetical protein
VATSEGVKAVVYVCVCVCERESECVCVCVCVCVGGDKRGGEGSTHGSHQQRPIHHASERRCRQNSGALTNNRSLFLCGRSLLTLVMPQIRYTTVWAFLPCKFCFVLVKCILL